MNGVGGGVGCGLPNRCWDVGKVRGQSSAPSQVTIRSALPGLKTSKHPEPSTLSLSLSLNPHLHQPVCTSALNPQTSQLICISLPKTRISEQSDASSQSSPAGNSVLMSFCTIYVTYGALWLFFFFQWVIYALLLIWETISHFGLFLALTFNCEFALLCFNLKLSRCWGEGGVSTILFHIELDTWRGVMKETLLWNTTGIKAISVRKGGGNLYHLCDIFFRTS